jgi:thymidine kinase
MTAKEKAEDILDKCYGVEVESVYFGVNHYLAKKFALIVVDECIQFEHKIVQEVETLAKQAKREFRCDGLFWDEVKNEIEKL